MDTVATVVYSLFALAVVAFAWSLWRDNFNSQRLARSQKRTASPTPGRHTGPSAAAAAEIALRLQAEAATWEMILNVLNPGQDDVTHSLLMEIRGPHMFDPRTGLGVIAAGCVAVPPGSSLNEGLSAAVQSMNRVVNAGR